MPDLVILDVNMPGGWSGFSTCQKFKLDPILSPIPIIFLSSTVGILYILMRRENKEVPFIPFLTIGVILCQIL